MSQIPGPNYVLDKGYLAGGAIGQFIAVKLSAQDTVVANDTDNGFCIGVCQELVTAGDATNGRVADIRMLGITRVVAGAAVTLGAKVKSDNAGKAIPIVATAGVVSVVMGIALSATSNAGEHIDILLTPGCTNNTAVS